MQRGRFSRLPVRADEDRPGALLHSASVLGLPHLLSISGRAKKTAARSGPPIAIAEGGKEIARRSHPKADRRTSHCAAARAERKSRAELDAVPRRRDPRIILQQRFATGGTCVPQRGGPRHLHRVSSHSRQRTEGACLSGRLAGARSRLALSRRGERPKRAAFHQQIATSDFAALDLVNSETLSAAHLD